MSAATLEIPTRKDLPVYNYTVVLDGVNYLLRYTWNDRMSKWFINVSDAGGTILINNVPLIANWPIIDRFRVSGQPPGSLLVFDTSLQNLDPARFDLGDRVRMFYLEEGYF